MMYNYAQSGRGIAEQVAGTKPQFSMPQMPFNRQSFGRPNMPSFYNRPQQMPQMMPTLPYQRPFQTPFQMPQFQGYNQRPSSYTFRTPSFYTPRG